MVAAVEARARRAHDGRCERTATMQDLLAQREPETGLLLVADERQVGIEKVLGAIAFALGDLTYAGREWLWTATISETGVENLFRVDVLVSLAASGAAIRTVTGFIGEPVQPGIANAAWSGLAGPGGSDEPGDDDDRTRGDPDAGPGTEQ